MTWNYRLVKKRFSLRTKDRLKNKKLVKEYVRYDVHAVYYGPKRKMIMYAPEPEFVGEATIKETIANLETVLADVKRAPAIPFHKLPGQGRKKKKK
jgi:hypothetical protein